jgi:hypothetical protein
LVVFRSQVFNCDLELLVDACAILPESNELCLIVLELLRCLDADNSFILIHLLPQLTVEFPHLRVFGVEGLDDELSLIALAFAMGQIQLELADDGRVAVDLVSECVYLLEVLNNPVFRLDL